MLGDNVSGLCSVGTTNMSALRGFVLVPSIIYLIAGAVLLSIGFVSLFRIRSSIRKGKIPFNNFYNFFIKNLSFCVPFKIQFLFHFKILIKNSTEFHNPFHNLYSETVKMNFSL